MRKTGRTKWAVLVVALALALTALPMVALAADEVKLFDGSGIVDSRESVYLQTPAGHIGDTISVYVPIQNTSGGALSNLSCSLAVSTDTTVFPFTNPDTTKTAVDWKTYQVADGGALVAWNGSALAADAHAYFKLEIAFAEGLSEGYYSVPFTVKCDSGTSTVKVVVYCRGVDTTGGSSSSSGGGSGYKSKPKVIIEAYEFEQSPIYAGDIVQLRLVITNTSSREAVTNLQLDYACESGAVIPAPGGSSSVFLGTIDKNGVRALTLNLQIAPDAEAKSQVLAVTLSYEGTKNRADLEEKASVNVPILQKARVRINDPVVYDDPWVGSNVSVGVSLYNLGKSPLYNCMVDVAGDELTLEESYFGGNIASGSSMNADISVIPQVAGDIEAKIRITYEDVYGNQTEELLPLKMTVNEEAPANLASPGDGGQLPTDQPASGGIGWIFWVLGGLTAAAGLVVLGIRLKKKRERELEDL
ncbi:MAG: hypothetical protein LLF75_01345 [Eubacteriales bacterium]|nr:hypothetical protein [Eubacteriales bacterium]